MSYSWEDICDSQDFVHTQRFVEVEDYRTLEAQFQELKKGLEEIANGHLQEKVSESIARQVLEELK